MEFEAEEIRAIWRERAQERARERRQRPVTWRRDQARQWRAELLALLGDECVRCGFSDPRALQVDHVQGGGWALRHKERSQKQLLDAVQADPSRFQLLCANCNSIKRIENGEIGGRRKVVQ